MLEKVKACCKKRGITIYRLEKDLGFSTGSISKWGSTAPSVNKVKAVADYFNVSIEELLEGDMKNE